MQYSEFLAAKFRTIPPSGFDAEPSDVGLFPHQRDLVRWAVARGRAAIFADTGLGKQQPITEPVLTPTGWRTMGDLRPGDEVIGSNGRATKVLGVFPQGRKRVFRLVLSDGSFARAGAEHLWSVRTKTHKARGQGFLTLSTQQIAESIHRDWQLPVVSAVEHARAALSIDPYALGVLLGDGSLRARDVSVCTDHWIGRALGWQCTREHDSCEYVGYYRPGQSTRDALGSMGLLNTLSDDKFIPLEYMHSSPEQRLSLLQGLMDTDGHAMPKGGAEFCSTSRAVFDAVCELVRSLGGVARGVRSASAVFTTTDGAKRKGKSAWRVNLKLPPGVAMFRLPRKASRYVMPSKYPPARIIRQVIDESIEEEQVCIKVAAPDSLYVTRDHILTHNTRTQIEWARLVHQHAGIDVLILAPLAVAAQTVDEGRKIGVAITHARGSSDVRPGINITNYDRLHRFDTSRFGAVVLDESSCIKHYNSKLLATLMQSFEHCRYRLACTATPAPNDYAELGTHAEFLGVCSRVEMLAEYFVHDSGDTQTWRLKGHARAEFWRWVASWAGLVRNPADLGYDGSAYVLPELRVIHHSVEITPADSAAAEVPHIELASTLTERRQARKASSFKRVMAAIDLVKSEPNEQWLLWGDLNLETGQAAALIPGAVEVRGPDNPEDKERALLDFASGRLRVLVSKPSIAGWGMNFQRCARMIFIGVSDSFESYYQAVRRCYRFGQTRPVEIHLFHAPAEGNVVENIARKESDARAMGEELARSTADAVRNNVRSHVRRHNPYEPAVPMRTPRFLRPVNTMSANVKEVE